MASVHMQGRLRHAVAPDARRGGPYQIRWTMPRMPRSDALKGRHIDGLRGLMIAAPISLALWVAIGAAVHAIF